MAKAKSSLHLTNQRQINPEMSRPRSRKNSSPLKTFLDQLLDQFDEGIDDILTDERRESDHNMKDKFFKLYNTLFVITSCKKRPPKINNKVDMSSRGRDIFNRIARCFDRHLHEVFARCEIISNDGILELYLSQWQHYQQSTKIVTNVCDYPNRHWFWQEDWESKTLTNTEQLSLRCWSKYVLTMPSTKRIVKILLKKIDDERRGEIVDPFLIHEITSSFVKSGLSLEEYRPKTILDEFEIRNFPIYKAVFEDYFLDETKNFYRHESAKFFYECSLPEYFVYVEKRLREEKKRCRENYLHPSTSPFLLRLCDEILIESRADIFITKFKNMIIDEHYEDTLCLSKFVSRFPRIIGAFHDFFQSHVQENGLSAIEKCGKDSSNPELYVNTIIEVYNRFSKLVSTVFKNDAGYVKCLDKACEKFVNYNCVTRSENSTSAKTAELFAKYCDSFLRKYSTKIEPDQLDDILNQVVSISKFIDDKDIFLKIYSRMLVRRLLNQSSNSHDAEEMSVISKLKVTCGSEYVAKLSRMFKDVGLNVNLNADLRKRQMDFSGIDFNIQVLTSGSWPFQQCSDLIIPPKIANCVQKFTDYYNTQHRGRKLSWLFQFSNGELVANCFKNKYTFQVSMFQIAILMQFNTGDNFTLQQLEDATRIKSKLLTQVVQVLLKSKLLVSDDDSDSLQACSTVRLFLQYKNKKQRININAPLRIEVKVEREATRKFVEIERKALLQAAIVRIMKGKKELLHQLLIANVFTEISPLFKPNVVDIKKCIDILIEKDYLERVLGQKNMYRYVA